jgi:hypothetical protein
MRRPMNGKAELTSAPPSYPITYPPNAALAMTYPKYFVPRELALGLLGASEALCSSKTEPNTSPSVLRQGDKRGCGTGYRDRKTRDCRRESRHASRQQVAQKPDVGAL